VRHLSSRAGSGAGSTRTAVAKGLAALGGGSVLFAAAAAEEDNSGGFLSSITSLFSSAPAEPAGPPPAFKLTYFNIEAAAEKVRLAFVLYGIDFVDDRIQFGEWADLKPKTKYGQLPLLSIDGAEPVAQSLAMLRYVGRLGDGSLYPQCKCKMLEVEEAMGLTEDMERAWRPCLYAGMRPQEYGYPEGYNKTEDGQALVKKLRGEFVATTLPKYLTYIEAQLDKHGGTFIAGDRITIADCHLLPTLNKFTKGFIDHVPTDCLNTHPKVVAYMARVMADPKIAAWYAAQK